MLYELILGFILAAIFIVSYLLISKLFSDEKQIQGQSISSLTSANSDHAIEEGQFARGLLTEKTEKKDAA